MGRRTCRACGARVSGAAAWCPYCGEQIYSRFARPIAVLIAGAVALLLVTAIVVLILSAKI